MDSSSASDNAARMKVKPARRPISFDFETNALVIQNDEKVLFQRRVDAAILESKLLDATDFVPPTFLNVRLTTASLVEAYANLTTAQNSTSRAIEATVEMIDCLEYCTRVWHQSTAERLDVFALTTLPPLITANDTNPYLLDMPAGLSATDSLGMENRRLLILLNEAGHLIESHSSAEALEKCFHSICTRIRRIRESPCAERPTFGITFVRTLLLNESRKLLQSLCSIVRH